MTLGNGEPNPILYPRFVKETDNYLMLLPEIVDSIPVLEAMVATGVSFDNGLFPLIDAAASAAMIRSERPRRYVELGSGYSTRVASAAILDSGLDTEIVSIDPSPWQDIDSLCDQVYRMSFEKAYENPELRAYIDSLEPGDIFFIDTSHIVKQGNELPLLHGTVLPRLPKGIILHIHDIFLPWDYPQLWVDQERGYTEQYLVLTMLVNSPKWRILWPSHWAQRRDEFGALREGLSKGTLGQFQYDGGSLWLTKD